MLKFNKSIEPIKSKKGPARRNVTLMASFALAWERRPTMAADPKVITENRRVLLRFETEVTAD